MKKVELFGGPRDGQVIDIEDSATTLRVPLFTSVVFTEREYDPKIPEIPIGIYEPITKIDWELGRWHWRGQY